MEYLMNEEYAKGIDCLYGSLSVKQVKQYLKVVEILADMGFRGRTAESLSIEELEVALQKYAEENPGVEIEDDPYPETEDEQEF